MNTAQRRAATERHELAIAAINEMFNKADELVAARDRLTGIKPLGADDDPIKDAETLLAHASELHDTLVQLRVAATAAAEYRNRGDLAGDLGTKPAVLFPRPGRPPGDTSPALEPRPPGHVALTEDVS